MYEWKSHTAEIELHIAGQSEEEVFADAVDAFSRYIELDSGGAPARYEVTVEASDRGALLVELIGELIFLADTESFITDRSSIRLDDGRLVAVLDGRRTQVDPLVKAATYHDLRFERAGEIWQARVVLDV
jgi:SHS2 domain-containing protein